MEHMIVNSHVTVEVETSVLLHSHLWMQFDPVHKMHTMNILTKLNTVLFIPSALFSVC